MKTTEMLNQLLADLEVIYQKQRNYHWNIEGHGFFQMHELLEKEYDAFSEFIDEVAETVRMKGERPLSTFKEFLDTTTLEEGRYSSTKLEMIDDIIADYEKILGFIREHNDLDSVTDDLFVAIEKHLVKALWMFKAERAD